jgi:hypothetical protein
MTPYGVVEVPRHVYQSSSGGVVQVPLDRNAHVFGKATPGLTKMINWKYATMSAGMVRQDMKINHGVKVSKFFIQNNNHLLGDLICEHEADWEYELPLMKEEVTTILLSRDGTTTPIKGEGYRETMAGTISFLDAKGQRMHTIYTGVAPESGKQSFDYVFSKEIEKVKTNFSNCTWVGVADGASDNWTFLEPYTDVQTLDFFHATGYLGNYAKKRYRGKHQRRNWVDEACHQLKHETGASQVLLAEMKEECEVLGVLEDKKNPMVQAVTYFTNHSAKMEYPISQQKNLPIGSGVVEAACKVLVKQRLSISGCRWERNTVDDILAVRGLVLTPGRYEQLWQKITHMDLGGTSK